VRLAIPIIAVLAWLPAACAGGGADDPLCRFGPQPEGTIVGHIDKRDARLIGEIDVKAVAEDTSLVASALARPLQPVYRRSDRADCRNEATGAWYPCTKVVEVDLSKVAVIARAFELDSAADYALDLCNAETAKLVPDVADVRPTSGKYRCTVSERRFCRLPE